jgi:hypothetical protein
MNLEKIADETEKYLLESGLEEEVKNADIKLPLRDNLRTDPRYADSDHYVLHYMIAYCHIKTGKPVPDSILVRMTLEGSKWAALCMD